MQFSDMGDQLAGVHFKVDFAPDATYPVDLGSEATPQDRLEITGTKAEEIKEHRSKTAMMCLSCSICNS